MSTSPTARAVAALAERLVDGRPVDILVNNAGTIERAPAVDHADASWDRVIEVDLSSQFVLTREVGRQMVARGSGKVIFTASMLSYQGGVNVVSYTAAKSAVAGMTRALANEWAPHGVNVNAIAPGYFATDNTDALRRDPERSRAILERIPAGRWGAPDDLGGAAVFLASRGLGLRARHRPGRRRRVARAGDRRPGAPRDVPAWCRSSSSTGRTRPCRWRRR